MKCASHFVHSYRAEQEPSEHWAMRLHNELQRRGKIRSLTWDDNVSGPPHKAMWTAVVYSKPYSHAAIQIIKLLLVDEVEYGRARSRRKQDARDQAAKQALRALEEELFKQVHVTPPITHTHTLTRWPIFV